MMRSHDVGHCLSDDLIICTKDRPDELERCLLAVAAQSHVPSRILIVDSSETDRPAGVVSEARRLAPFTGRLDHVKSRAGLPHQRNTGIRMTENSLVHFIDDDSIVDPAYFSAILSIFERDALAEIAGVGGLITNLPEHTPSRALEAFQLDNSRVGIVLPSGKNVLVFTADREVDVDWLSGSSMSFRRDVFDQHAFNESLAGWALGEDVEFTYRVRQDRRLVVTPEARTEHRQSPHGRWKLRRIVQVELVHRHARVVTGVGRYSPYAFWLSVVGQLLILCPYISLAHSPLDGLRYFTGTCLGVAQIWFRKLFGSSR